MRIIGIDPGYDRLGAAIVERVKGPDTLLESLCTSTAKDEPFSKRLFTVADSVEKLIRKWEPSTMVLEKLFFTNNQKTAGGVSEVRGVLLYLAAKYNLQVIEFNPLQVKMSVTGYGNADKKQVADMVKRLILIDPNKEIRFDDEYDAIAIAITGLVNLAAQGHKNP